jgi:chromosome segregation ATPase
LSSKIKSSPPPSSSDLEETAELPQLSPIAAAAIDPLSTTDAWTSQSADDGATTANVPTLTHQLSRRARAEAAAQQPDQHEAEIGALRSDLASVNESRSQLERDLQSLGGNLRDLEQMLNRKSEQLSVYEREVGQRDRRIAELETRVEQLDSELASRQAQFDNELASRQMRFDAELVALNAQRSGLQEGLSKTRADGEAMQARNAAQAAELGALKSERAELAQRCQSAEIDLAQWRMRGERYRESLQSQEGRRQLYEGMIAEREARIATLERDFIERERLVGAREEDLRITVRGQEERVRELDAARTRADAAAATARDRIAALEAENRAQQQAVREQSVQSQAREKDLNRTLTTQQQRNGELEAARARASAEAASARDRIAALEAENRAQQQAVREQSVQSLAREKDLNRTLSAQQQRNGELEAATARANAEAASARERITSLEADSRKLAESLAELREQAQAREEAMSSALRAEQQRTAELERTRFESDRAAAAARTQAEAEAASARGRIENLEAESQKLFESLTQLRAQTQAREEELNAALRAEQQLSAELKKARDETAAAAAAMHAEAETDAATARDQIAALSAETQQQAESLKGLRAELHAASDSLAQRNALIERVEVEAASSVAMLGNIQHNLEHLGVEDQPHLLVRSDGGTGIVHLLGRRTTIGRTPDNDVHIDAEFISRHHAVALRAGAKTVIEDLNSTNGTYVNGQRVNRRTLKDGDLVTLGKTEFRFSINKAMP